MDFIEKCCKEICKHPEDFLSESDIVCELYRRVATQIDWRKLHTEVRPYRPDPENISNIRSVICTSDRWKTVKLRNRRKKNPNYALRVDFAVVNYDIFKAIRIPNKGFLNLNYVPIEALEVVVEVKHGFRNHETVITRDLEKLAIIKKENPKCDTIMLVVTTDDVNGVAFHSVGNQEVADKLKVNLIY